MIKKIFYVFQPLIWVKVLKKTYQLSKLAL